MEGQFENIDRTLCPACGGGNETGTQYCVHCGYALPRSGKTWFTKRLFLGGAGGLVLIGAILFFLKGGFDRGLIGKVNGDGITRKEFSTRLERVKNFYENRYGKDLFQGEGGKENLNRLKTDLLDEMTTEKILLQEARSAGYTSAPAVEIEKQIEAIKKQSGLSDADLAKMMGGSIEDLKAELRNGWIISQFVEKAVLKGDQTNADLLVGQWLTQVKAKAKIENYEKLEPVSTAKASCCGSGGGCGGGGRAQPLDPKMEQEAKAKGLEYYERKTQKKGADAKVTNFGCHIQVDIIENDKVVLSLTYNRGEVQEI